MPEPEVTPPMPGEVTPQSIDANRVVEGQPIAPGDPEKVEAAVETAEDVGEAAVGEAATQIPVSNGSVEAVSEENPTDSVPEGREPDANRAHYMADKDKELQMAASMAEQIGRPEKAEELRQSADVEAQKGAEEYDRDQRREAEKRVIELRIEENERRASEEARQRREELVNQMLDQILDGVNLPPGQSADLLDDNYWPEGWGSDPAIAELYQRMGLERPTKDAVPAYSWDISEGGRGHFLDGKNVHAIRRYENPTTLGTTLLEIRYKTPPYGIDERVKLLVRKDLQEQPAAA